MANTMYRFIFIDDIDGIADLPDSLRYISVTFFNARIICRLNWRLFFCWRTLLRAPYFFGEDDGKRLALYFI